MGGALRLSDGDAGARPPLRQQAPSSETTARTTVTVKTRLLRLCSCFSWVRDRRVVGATGLPTGRVFAVVLP